MPHTSSPVRSPRPLQVYLVRKPDSLQEYPVPLNVDSGSECLVVISEDKFRVHAGQTFISEYSAEIPDNEYSYIMFLPTREIHFLRSLNISGAAEMSVYEGVTADDPGTEIPVHNKNRYSNNPQPLNVYHTPSGLSTAGAVVLYNKKAMGGGATTQTRIGAQHIALNEWVLKPVWYCIEIHNLAGVAISFSYELECYYI